MAADRLKFNFHDRLGLVLAGSDSQWVDFFHSELAFAEGELGADLPLVRLDCTASSEDEKDDAPLIPAAHKLLARWRYGINIHGSEIHLRVAGNYIAIPIVFHTLVLPSLGVLAAGAGEILLHGAAVVKSDRSIILTGKRGIGKTTVSAVLLEYGGKDWALHADDYVFIDSQQMTHAFLTRMHLYRNLLQWSPGIANRLRLWDRGCLEILGLLRAITRGRLMWPLRIPQSRLWPGRAAPGSASLSAIVILQSNRTSSVHLELLLPKDRAMRELESANLPAASRFKKLAGRCRDLPGNWAQEWQSQEMNLLKEITERVPIYGLSLPTSPDPQSSIQRQIAGLLNTIISRRT